MLLLFTNTYKIGANALLEKNDIYAIMNQRVRTGRKYSFNTWHFRIKQEYFKSIERGCNALD